ncbi:MAG: hypothetical protein P8N76_27855 [Pirellulaceae bacterium]|nr:hypothetical protein [Pirellulaceae bacterium]
MQAFLNPRIDFLFLRYFGIAIAMCGWLKTPTAEGTPVTLSVSSHPLAIGATLFYDPSNGYLRARSAGADFTTLELHSLSAQFIPAGSTPAMSPFDLALPEKLFRLRVDGITEIEFGQVMPPDLGPRQVIDDLLIDGSFLGGGDLQSRGNGPYLLIVPEPASGAIVLMGMLGTLAFRQAENGRKRNP